MVPLEIGDIVQLKSGGPPMTVELVYGENIHCIFFDSAGLRHNEAFVFETLKIISAAKFPTQPM